jgi:hypothetical protein
LGQAEQLLAETIAAAQRQQALKPSELRRVNVDATVQEKAIAFLASIAAERRHRIHHHSAPGRDIAGEQTNPG